MADRYVYLVEYHSAEAGVDDAGVYGTLTRARGKVKRDGCTRRTRRDIDVFETWVEPGADLDENGNTDDFAHL